MTNIGFSGTMFGFAKLKGYSPWPARKTGHVKGKLWVSFFGSKQIGTVSHKNWTDLTPESIEKIGLKYSKKGGYAIALKEMVKVYELNNKSDSNENAGARHKEDHVTGDVNQGINETVAEIIDSLELGVRQQTGVSLGQEVAGHGAGHGGVGQTGAGCGQTCVKSSISTLAIRVSSLSGKSNTVVDVNCDVSDDLNDTLLDLVSDLASISVGASENIKKGQVKTKGAKEDSRNQAEIRAALAKKSLQDSQLEVLKNFSESRFKNKQNLLIFLITFSKS